MLGHAIPKRMIEPCDIFHLNKSASRRIYRLTTLFFSGSLLTLHSASKAVVELYMSSYTLHAN